MRANFPGAIERGEAGYHHSETSKRKTTEKERGRKRAADTPELNIRTPKQDRKSKKRHRKGNAGGRLDALRGGEDRGGTLRSSAVEGPRWCPVEKNELE